VALDPADFAKRDWVPKSGWPISRAGIQPFYDRACDLLRIPRFDLAHPTLHDAARPALDLDGGRTFFSAPRHFTHLSGAVDRPAWDRFRQDFAPAANVAVHLNANVTELKLTPGGDRIERLDVACLNGRRHTARAKVYVLATGGIENARLLLASNSVEKAGVGNRHDLVGRYFQGHQTFGAYSGDRRSHVAMTGRPQSMALYTDSNTWGASHCVLAPTHDGQRRLRIGNCTATLSKTDAKPGADTQALRALAAQVDGGAAPATETLLDYFFMSEHRPNPDSRVTLGAETDALGMPRVKLAWTNSKADWDSLEAGVGALAAELGAAGQARLAWPVARARLLAIASPSRHHMGTTRMHADPREGVVDAQGRVHGTPNLYVAGSSVFPTSGIGNPSLTLLALALRLSDHLKLELGAAR
jgi:choline dehydrogenase-like flavoprotein